MIDFAASDNEEERLLLAINVSGVSDFSLFDSTDGRAERAQFLHLLACADMVYLQARLFRNIDLEKLEYTTFDGWSRLGPAYSV